SSANNTSWDNPPGTLAATAVLNVSPVDREMIHAIPKQNTNNRILTMTTKNSNDLKSANSEKSNCWPIATPTITSPVLRKTDGHFSRSFIKNCEINTENIGPISHGIGNESAENRSAPISAITNTRSINSPLLL